MMRRPQLWHVLRSHCPGSRANTRDDQVIENEQRESLSPLELAMFVQKKLQSGARSSEIARTLGKSRGLTDGLRSHLGGTGK